MSDKRWTDSISFVNEFLISLYIYNSASNTASILGLKSVLADAVTSIFNRLACPVPPILEAENPEVTLLKVTVGLALISTEKGTTNLIAVVLPVLMCPG